MFRRRWLDVLFSATGAGTPEDPYIPNVNVTGVVDGDVVVDFTDVLTALGDINTALAAILAEQEAQTAILTQIETNTQ